MEFNEVKVCERSIDLKVEIILEYFINMVRGSIVLFDFKIWVWESLDFWFFGYLFIFSFRFFFVGDIVFGWDRNIIGYYCVIIKFFRDV